MKSPATRATSTPTLSATRTPIGIRSAIEPRLGTWDALSNVLSFGVEHIPDVARCGCEPDAQGLAPLRLVYLVFVADRQVAGYFARDENGVIHLSAGMTIFGFDLFPKLEPAELEVREFLFDLPPQAVFFALSRTSLTAGEHPQMVTLPPYQQEPATLERHEL